MKVKEIIEELSKADPETEVHFEMDVGCCGDTMDVVVDEVRAGQYTIKNKEYQYATFKLDAVAGYYSCRQIGVTIKSHNDYWEPFNKEYLVDRHGNPLKTEEPKFEMHPDGVKEVE